VRIRVRPSFIGYILILICFAGYHSCIGLLTALIIHESLHAAAAKLLKEPVISVELAPFGGVMRYKLGSVPSKGIRGTVLALAGPAGNYAVILLMGFMRLPDESEWCRAIVQANLCMMLLNLVPALPFDGGSAVFSVGFYLFDVSRLIEILSCLGMLSGGFLCLVALIGFMRYGILNMTLLIVGLYVFFYAKESKGILLAQNMYTVLYERSTKNTLSFPASAALCRISGEEQLCSLTACLCRAGETLFFVEKDDGRISFIGSHQLCSSILRKPGAQVNSIIEKLENST